MIVVLSNGESIDTDSANVGARYVLAELLVEAMRDLGKKELSYQEIKDYPRLPDDPNIYAFWFGSLAKACVAAPRLVRDHAESQQSSHPGERIGYLSSARYGNKQKQYHSLNREVAKMSREEILDRLIDLYENGRLSQNNIERDPLLTWAEVQRLFGSNITAIKSAARRELYDRKHAEVQRLFGNNIKTIKSAVRQEMYDRKHAQVEAEEANIEETKAKEIDIDETKTEEAKDNESREGESEMEKTDDELKEDIRKVAAAILEIDEGNDSETKASDVKASDVKKNKNCRWTEETAIDAYYEACVKMGRWIRYEEIREFSKRGEMASLGTVSRRFGGLRKMQESVISKYGKQDWMTGEDEQADNKSAEIGSPEEQPEEVSIDDSLDDNDKELEDMIEVPKDILENEKFDGVFNPRNKRVIVPVEWVETEEIIYVKKYQII